MFFLFFPLPFSVNSVPSALASVKNKISLTMRSPPCLASVPSPTASAPLLFLPGLLEAATIPLGVPLHPSSQLPACLPRLAHSAGWWGGSGRRRDEEGGAWCSWITLTPHVHVCVCLCVGALGSLTCECFCESGQVMTSTNRVNQCWDKGWVTSLVLLSEAPTLGTGEGLDAV